MSEVLRTAGRYELLRQIGHGGMATVYLARQTDLDRFVALKELRISEQEPSLASRFLREARTAGSLSHPNIVTVHEHFQFEGTPYIAMEYLERGSLRPYIGRMTVPQVIGVLEGLLAGLDHAAHHDIVHRDLKPENVMVAREGRVKIADFGIARARNQLNTGSFVTVAGSTVGTPTYMAPEQAMAKDIGPYTDLYSLGVIAYEMLVGRPPFHEIDTPVAILMRHMNDEIPPAHVEDPSIDPALSAWVSRLLVKDWRERTPTAAQAWDELEDLVITMLGSRWRRDARLPEISPQGGTDRPLTPADFQPSAEMRAATSTDDADFASFVFPAERGVEVVSGAEAIVDAEADVEPASEAAQESVVEAEPEPVVEDEPVAEAEPEPAVDSEPVAPADADAEFEFDFRPATPEGPRSYETYGEQPVPDGESEPEPEAESEPEPEPESVEELVPAMAATIPPRSKPAAEQAAAQGPAREAANPRRRIAVLVAAGVVALGIGVAIGLSGGSEPAPAAIGPLAKGDAASVQLPSGWRTMSENAVPIMLDGAAAGATSTDATSRISVGKIDQAVAADLLPAIARPATTTPVQLAAGVQALRSTGISIGNWRGTAYAVPTSNGVVAVFCDASVPAAQCGTAASTLKLSAGTTPQPLGANAKTGAAIAAALTNLERSAVLARAALREAKRRAGQASSADRLRGAYRRAAQAVDAIDAPAGAVAAVAGLSRGLGATANAYDRLRASALAGDAARYRKAAAALQQAGAQLDRARRALVDAGYGVTQR